MIRFFRMKAHRFYIKNGRAIQHPIEGGTITAVSGQSTSIEAINVQAQGDKVLVSYEDGSVTEHPYPGTGGTIRTLVQAKRGWRRSEDPSVSPSRSVNSNQGSNTSDSESSKNVILGLILVPFLAIAVWLFVATVLGPMALLFKLRYGISFNEGMGYCENSKTAWFFCLAIWAFLSVITIKTIYNFRHNKIKKYP